MAYEMTWGMLISDDEKYAQYRASMSPLLEAAGGRFRYDFQIARTLRSQANHEINRLFMIEFPDRAASERFFADPQ